MRTLLFGLALAAVLMSGPMAALLWKQRTWPYRTLLVGGALLLLYILTGQVKAFVLGIPFDIYSWIGLLGAAVFDGGLIWILTQRPRHDRG